MPIIKRNKLFCEDHIINKKFKTLSDFIDIADLLEISAKDLRRILIVGKKNNYTSFNIKKKNGNNRLIHAPKKNLSILQKKFSHVLSLNYKSHLHAHGFIKERSIVTNATPHLKSQFVLNFDLENFFGSISFARVRAMFLSYYKFNETVSTTLANLCCNNEGFLPQGGATSPIISNIISYRMDKEFKKLAQKNHCTYTRYADDITFSTKKNKFPEEIACFNDSFKVELSSEIIKIIKSNGFNINNDKTRLNHSKEHLEVTGITVNEKLNISKTYIRRIRSILHCIEKNIEDIEKAREIFNLKYAFRQLKNKDKPEMFDVVRGMISHVANVKGKEDSVYLKLAKRYNEVIQGFDKPFLRVPLTKQRLVELNTFLIESLGYEYIWDDEIGIAYTGQGTGFLLKGIGLITNFHVLADYIELLEFGGKFTNDYNIRVNRSRYSMEKNYAKLLSYDKSKDIAILEIKDLDIINNGFHFNENIMYNQKIELVGYPSYTENMELSFKDGEIKGERFTLVEREQRYEISAQIFGGNSGGPVLNINNEVVALAVKGANGKDTVPNEVIPIKTVIDFAKQNNLIKD